jgi:hypothetical protein
MTKSMWKPARRTSHSKTMGINLLLYQPPLFWEGFPQDVGTLLQGLASIQPLTGTKGPSPNHEKQHMTKLYSWHYAFGQLAFSWHPPKPDLSVRLPDGEAFILLQSPMAASFTPLQPMLGVVHGDFRLVCGCSAMQTHLMKLLTNSYCVDVASRPFGTQ